MKTIMKILFAPLIVLMWIAIKIGSLITYILGLALGILSGIIAVISIVYMFTGAGMNGFIGLVIAYLLSPYGIPMFAIMILGIIQRARVNLQSRIYR
ncbi:MAG: CD1845 family protein [bacterium]|nr:CD1845 family protein [bacterium]